MKLYSLSRNAYTGEVRHIGKMVAVVTGGSFGIGGCAAEALMRAGCVAYESSCREIPQLDRGIAINKTKRF